MPIMTITTPEGRTREEKQSLAEDLTVCIQELLKRPPEIIRVIFYEIPFENYAIAGRMLSPEDARRNETILRISILSGRTAEQKQELIAHLRAVMEAHPAFSSSAIRIIVEENCAENFYRS